MRVLGVDACRSGWVAIELGDGTFVAAYEATTLAELVDRATGVSVIGVDMPLGLVETGWRAADVAAAAVLGPRRSSLFRVPPRLVWDEPDFAAANQRCRELTGGGLTRQAWALRVKLREANECRRRWPDLLYEVHPEVSFRHLAGTVLSYPKTTWNGLMLRRDLLRRHGVVLPDDAGAAAGRAAPDDVVDAAAAAWSADRIAAGRAVTYPDPPEPSYGPEQIAIWT